MTMPTSSDPRLAAHAPGGDRSVAAGGSTSSEGYRFLLEPRWLMLSTVVVALIVGMVSAASWQWSRHRELQGVNRTLVARSALEPVPLDEVVGLDSQPTEDMAYRRVRVTGSFAPADQVLIRQRSQFGVPGVWAMAPLALDGGGTILVGRGWLASPDGASVPQPLVTGAGTELGESHVELVGQVMLSQSRGQFGSVDPPDGPLSTLARVDVARVAQQLDGPVYPVWIQLASTAPLDLSTGTIVEPPAPDPGNHFSYTGQWLIFSLLAGLGWVVVVRRHLRSRHRS